MFAENVSGKDRLFVLPVFYAGGTAPRTISSASFVQHLKDLGIAAETAPDYDWLLKTIPASLSPHGVILVMGARDPDLPELAAQLAAATSNS